MSVHGSSSDQPRVLIAGGGFAALEAALALRALAADQVRLTLISPDHVFGYRPAATIEVFEEGSPRTYDLRVIAEHAGAEYHKSLLESVASQKRYVRTSSGARLEYNALILATGARATAGIPGALTFRDQRDVHLFRHVLEELEAGAIRRVLFAVPSGCSWPLPLYELALLSAARAHERGVEVELSLVSPEREPLGLFGPQASRLVADLLTERGVRFVGATAANGVCRDGSLMLHSDGAIRADRVVAVPELRGRRIAGVPASWWGFVPVDMFGRVEGLADVYAAGDITTFPIKQGGLATQQADRIAHTIAAGLEISVKEERAGHVLQARLLGGERPIFLRTELDAYGQPTSASLEHTEKDKAASQAKLLGRYLRPYLETLDSLPGSRLAAA